MTYSDAVNSLTIGQACKRPDWGGYIKKIANSESGAGEGSFELVYVAKGNDNYYWGYTYTVNSTTGIGVWAASDPDDLLEVDAQMQESLLADDWMIGNAAEFETARSGAGGGEW